MIKRLRVTVDGNTYDVTVEMAEDLSGQATSAPIAAAASPPGPAPVAPPAPGPTPPPPPPTPPSPTAAGPAAAGDVPSPLAGRVTAVVVTPGQTVKEGDHLLTLEAMKMNTFVFAPKSGKVAEIKTAVGDAVEENQVLMRIT
jgi:glutaconyl-CoA/methylmalonyl-CoA decarboxylase subunit gamma